MSSSSNEFSYQSPAPKSKGSPVPNTAQNTVVNPFASPDGTGQTINLYGGAATPRSTRKTPRTAVKLKQECAKKLAVAIVENILSKDDDTIRPEHFIQFGLRFSDKNLTGQTQDELSDGLDSLFIDQSYQVLFKVLHIINKVKANKEVYDKQNFQELKKFTDAITTPVKTVDLIGLVDVLELGKLIYGKTYEASDIANLTNLIAAAQTIDPLELAELVHENTTDILALAKLIVADMIGFFERNKKQEKIFAEVRGNAEILSKFTESGKSWYTKMQAELLERIAPESLVNSDSNNPNVDIVAADSHEVALDFIMNSLRDFQHKMNSQSVLGTVMSMMRKLHSSDDWALMALDSQSQKTHMQWEEDQLLASGLQEQAAVEKGELMGGAQSNTVDQTPVRESMHGATDIQQALTAEVINVKFTQDEKEAYLNQLLIKNPTTTRDHLIAIAVENDAHKNLSKKELKPIEVILKSLKEKERVSVLKIQTSDWRIQLETALMTVVKYVNEQIDALNDQTTSGQERKTKLSDKLTAIHTALIDIEANKPVTEVLESLNKNTAIKKTSNFFTFKPQTLKKINKIVINAQKYIPASDSKATVKTHLGKLAHQCVGLREEKEVRYKDRGDHLRLATTLLDKMDADLLDKINSRWSWSSDKAMYKNRRKDITTARKSIQDIAEKKDVIAEDDVDTSSNNSVATQQADVFSELSTNTNMSKHRSIWACIYRPQKTTDISKDLSAAATMVGGKGYNYNRRTQ